MAKGRDLERGESPAGRIVGSSHAIREVIRMLAKVSDTNTSVLLVGESGTGKELAARAIHRQSPRSAGPFVGLNCGAIPSTLAESILFGHERGAFTDAHALRRGHFEQADGGTIFLDEVGEIPGDVQVKMLRVLEEREVVRIGGDGPVPVDVRVIAATNRDLLDDMRRGLFRSDLYWRLNVVQLTMPPLRARLEDIPLLVDALLTDVNRECQSTIAGVSDDVFKQFERHAWPGNIRELTNVLRHGAIMAESDLIQVQDLPAYLSNPRGVQPEADDGGLPEGVRLEDVMNTIERRLVESTLRRFKGNRSAAAAALGIDRRTLYNKIENLRLRSHPGGGTTKR